MFKIGEKVRFKTKKEFDEEFELNEDGNYQLSSTFFTKKMHHLFGVEAKIGKDSSFERIELSYVRASGDLSWHYTADMFVSLEEDTVPLINNIYYNIGETVTFCGVDYKVREGIVGGEFYLQNKEKKENSKMFSDLNISDKYHFVSDILGYDCYNGDFPYINSLDDLNKVIKKLKEIEAEGKENQATQAVSSSIPFPSSYGELKANYESLGVEKVRKGLYQYEGVQYQSLKELFILKTHDRLPDGKNMSELGYKRGDEFVVLYKDGSFNYLETIFLEEDNDSHNPFFVNKKGKKRCGYISRLGVPKKNLISNTGFIDDVEPIKTQTTSSIEELRREIGQLKRDREERTQQQIREIERIREEEKRQREEAVAQAIEQEKKRKLFPTKKKTKTTRGEAWNDVVLPDLEWRMVKHSFNKKQPLLLKGKSGTGKSSIIKALAKDEGLNIVQYNFNGDTTVENLLGHKILVGGDMVWEDGPLTDAVRNGKIFLGDEINTSNVGVQFILNGLLEKDGKLAVQGNNGEVLKPHKSFRFYGTYNPGYLGTNTFSTSLMSRFISIEIKPLAKQEEQELLVSKFGQGLAPQIEFLVDLENYLRDNKDFSYDVSTRDLEQALLFCEAGFSIKEAVTATITNSCQLSLEEKIISNYLTDNGQ